MKGVIQKEFWLFFVLLNFAAGVLLNTSDQPDMRVGKIFQSEVVIASAIRKSNTKLKSF